MASRATRVRSTRSSPGWVARLDAAWRDELLHVAAELLLQGDRLDRRVAILTAARKPCRLLELNHDALGVIVDGLANPLQPVVAVAFSSTCKGLRTPLRAALEVLRQQHFSAKSLCFRMNIWPDAKKRLLRVQRGCVSTKGLRETERLTLSAGDDLTWYDMEELGVLLTRWLPSLLELAFKNYEHSWADGVDADLSMMCGGMQVPYGRLLQGLGCGAALSLRVLDLGKSNLQPKGAESLAAALRRGAMPKLETLLLNDNPKLKAKGVSALAASLRKLPALKKLSLFHCKIGDEGVASLVHGLGKDDFKALKELHLSGNLLTGASCGQLTAMLDSGLFPRLETLELYRNLSMPRGDELTVHAALKRAKLKRGFYDRPGSPEL